MAKLNDLANPGYDVNSRYQLNSSAQVVKVGVRRDAVERLLRQQRLLFHAHRPPGDVEVVAQFLEEEGLLQSPSVVLVVLIWKGSYHVTACLNQI